MVTIYLDPEELAAFEEIRWRERKGKGETAREAILEYIKAHGSGNDTYKLENWEDPNFQAVPAFLSDLEKWTQHYRNTDDCDRMKLRIQAMNMLKKFRMVDTNP